MEEFRSSKPVVAGSSPVWPAKKYFLKVVDKQPFRLYTRSYVKQLTTFIKNLCDNFGAIVYRLGHQVFILRSGVRLPVALPNFISLYANA